MPALQFLYLAGDFACFQRARPPDIVAADVIGPGSVQPMLLPVVQQAALCRQAHTLITVDAAHRGRPLHSQRIGTVEPVLANIRQARYAAFRIAPDRLAVNRSILSE